MVELEISKRDKEVSHYAFDQGSIIIGRAPENEVCLNSPSVSPQHARLSLVEGACSIRNLADKGGTYVNNLEIKHAQLYDRDVIQIGNYSILFSISRGANSEVSSSAENIGTEPEPALNAASPSNPQAGQTTVVSPAPVPDAATLYPNPEVEVDEAPPVPDTMDYLEATGATEQPADAEQSQVADVPTDLKGTVQAQDQVEPAPGHAENTGNRPTLGASTIPESSPPPLHGTGIDMMSGPAEGKRVYFTRDRAVLGIKDVTAVVIRSVQEGYVAQAPNEDIVVTLNGDVISQNPVPLDSGDLIAFGNLKARFFIENPVD